MVKRLTSVMAGILLAAAPAAPAVGRVWTVAGRGTADVQSAIDACAAAGGGRVDVSAGAYGVAPLELRSHVELHLDRGATLRFSRNFSDYPLAWVDDGRGPEAGVRSPIWAEGAVDVAITGDGVIDGQGDAWRQAKRSKLPPADWDALVRSGGVTDANQTEWFPAAIDRTGRADLARLLAAHAPLDDYVPLRPLLRPKLVRLTHCTGVRLAGVTFRNSAMWNVHLSMCDHVDVRGVTIFNPIWAQNGDGIDIDSCRDVTMAECTVNAGDDAICIKSGQDAAGRKRARPTENVTISNCTVGTGHGGVVIGSEMSGGVRHVRVSHCTFTGTDNGLRFKSVRGRGGVVEDVAVDDVKMSDIGGTAVLFDLYYFTKPTPPGTPPPPVTDATPAFRDFHISHVTCDGAKQALLVRGLPEMPLHDVTLDDVVLKAKTAGLVADADGVVCRDVHVTAADGSMVSVTDAPDMKRVDSTGFQP